MFSKSENFLCSWHVQRNLKKKFSSLNRASNKDQKQIYQRIIMLPLTNDEEDFEKKFKIIIKSSLLTKDEKAYLKNRYNSRGKWVKAFMKEVFCCGMCTSSRIEAKHRVFKQFLNSSSRLSELYLTFKKLEDKEVTSFKDEIQKLKKKSIEALSNNDIISDLKDNYSEYINLKLQKDLIDSTNYKIQKVCKNTW